MATRVIQGFFIGGRAHPAPGVARATTLQPQPATAARALPGRPPAAFSSGAAALQTHGAKNSFAVDPVQLGLARGGGTPLPAPVLAKMEAAFGADFSGVRVHVGPQAARIGAIAFTTGNDIYFAPGRYQPESVQGQQLIGHELAHVVQQRQGRVRMPGSGVAVVQDHALEAEADRLGARAAMHRAPVQAKRADGSAAVQRKVAVDAPVRTSDGRLRLTARENGTQVGSVMVRAGHGGSEITDLAVDPRHRDRGIGRMLLASAAQTSLRQGGTKVALHADDNGSGKLLRWYKSLGFQQTGVDGRGKPELVAPITRLLSAPIQRFAAPVPRTAPAPHIPGRVVQRAPIQAKHGAIGPRAASGGVALQRAAAAVPVVDSDLNPVAAGSNSMSAMALRLTGIPEIYWRWIYRGGTVYRRTGTDPLTVFRDGWTRDGYESLVTHTDTDQGVGSNWVATTKDLTGMDESYGTYAFEIDIEWHQGVLVNPAYQTLTGHRNPHAEQNEVAVWGKIAGAQIKAVWVPKPRAEVPASQRGVWAAWYTRYTRQGYIDARAGGKVAHPPF